MVEGEEDSQVSTSIFTDLGRVSNWESVWGEFIANFARGPIIWGQNDCMLMGGYNLEVLTGEDIWTEHVKKYDTEFGAFRYLKSEVGVEDCEAFWDQYLPTQPVAMAKRGDLVLFDGCVGICLGRKSLFKCDEEDGVHVEMIDTLNCNKAWKI